MMTLEDADRIRRNPGAFDAATESEARRVMRGHLHVVATMPPRTPEAMEAPQRFINANQIIADEYRDVGRKFLRVSITAALTIVIVLMLVSTAVKAGPKLRWDLAWIDRMEQMQ